VAEPLQLEAPSAPIRAAAARRTWLDRADALARGLRPRHWLKNVLVVAAPGAAGVLTHDEVLEGLVVAIATMCLVASATYLLNDVLDVEADRAHPQKRLRPLASGDLPIPVALGASAVLLSAGLAIGATLGHRFLLVVLTYVGVTLAYSLWLKRIEVVDVAAVATCYLLRALAGSVATSVPMSSWFLILASAAAVFVVAGKRAADAAKLRAAEPVERVGRGPDYPLPYLRYLWMLASGVAIAAYCLWAFAVPHLVDGIAWSQVSIVPFALAIMRYALVVERGGGSAPEDVLLHDRALEVIAGVWLVVYAIGVYAR
jgi:decaprenyl-phosphate phosphoribosyltransferase